MKTLTKIFSDYKSREKQVSEAVSQLASQGISPSEYQSKLESMFGPRESNCWFNMIGTPVAEQIKEAGGYSKVEVIGPMGLTSRLAFHCYQDDGSKMTRIASLTVEPDLDLETGFPLYKIDFKNTLPNSNPNSLASINLMDAPKLPIDHKTKGEMWLKLLDYNQLN